MHGVNIPMYFEYDGCAFKERRVATAKLNSIAFPQYEVHRNRVKPKENNDPLIKPHIIEVTGCIRWAKRARIMIEYIWLSPDGESRTNGNTGGGTYGKCESYTPSNAVDSEAIEHMARWLNSLCGVFMLPSKPAI